MACAYAFDDPAMIEPERPADAAAAEDLVDAAFGPGRYAKTAERLREGNTPVLAFVARRDRRVVGSVRLWPVTVGGAPALFLGPIAVDEAERKSGVGAALVEAACAAAEERGWSTVLLVGDTPYFGRFGFQRAEGVTLPGPVDPRRVLVRCAGEARRGMVVASLTHSGYRS